MTNDNIQANSEKKVVIELDNVRRDFLVGEETVHALKGVSFKIYEGEFVTIMGKSGSGKSTLLNQLGCLDTPSSGEYYLDGVSVRKMSRNDRAILRNRKIGFIFQNYNKHDYDFTRCRHAWRCETGCFVNGDAEASRLSEHQRRM